MLRELFYWHSFKGAVQLGRGEKNATPDVFAVVRFGFHWVFASKNPTETKTQEAKLNLFMQQSNFSPVFLRFGVCFYYPPFFFPSF